jgi:NAD(P)H-dependent FMN reductase
MPHVVILSSSIRIDRASHRVALFMEHKVRERGWTADLIDLNALQFPLFEERLKHLPDPPASVTGFADRVRRSDGVVIVSPEYNGSIPASLKNVIDLLTDDWKGRPVALCAVSSGAFGGSQLTMQLLVPLWKIKAWVVQPALQVPKVKEAFDEQGLPGDAEAWDRRAAPVLDAIAWAMEANERMRT